MAVQTKGSQQPVMPGECSTNDPFLLCAAASVNGQIDGIVQL